MQSFQVEGTTYAIEGDITGLKEYCKGGLTKNIKQLAEIMAICNDSQIMKKDGVIRPAGLPTEAALKVLNEKIGNYDNTFKRS